VASAAEDVAGHGETTAAETGTVFPGDAETGSPMEDDHQEADGQPFAVSIPSTVKLRRLKLIRRSCPSHGRSYPLLRSPSVNRHRRPSSFSRSKNASRNPAAS
jgi:hypothetical protein